MVATLSPSPPPLDGDSMFLKPFASLSVHLSIFRVSVCLSVFPVDLSFPSDLTDLIFGGDLATTSVSSQA